MTKIDYSISKYPVRDDFADGHNRYWRRLAAPGAWLSGAQRVAVAQEVRQARSCKLCQQRKVALSPYQIQGAHDTNSDLSDIMIDVVHRVVSDSGRLTKSWFDDVIQQGLKVEEYIEIIGTLVHAMSIDEFCRGIGVPLNDLPEPIPGEPSHYQPEELSFEVGTWMQTLPRTVDSGPDSDIWSGELGGNVILALSLVPDEVRSLIDLSDIHYLEIPEIMDLGAEPKGPLSRSQIELVAGRVSALNSCFY